MADKNRQTYYLRNKALWMDIIKQKGMDYCWKCGYNKHFGAIDMHHIEGNKKEQVRVCLLFGQVPNAERIQELEKCMPLCATCHRAHHIEEGSVGQPATDVNDQEEIDSQMSFELSD